MTFPNRGQRARRLTAAQNATLTLATGLMTVDENNVLYVHDGSTAGGVAIQSKGGAQIGTAEPEGSVTGGFVGQYYEQVTALSGGTRVASFIFTGTPGANTGWI